MLKLIEFFRFSLAYCSLNQSFSETARKKKENVHHGDNMLDSLVHIARLFPGAAA